MCHLFLVAAGSKEGKVALARVTGNTFENLETFSLQPCQKQRSSITVFGVVVWRMCGRVVVIRRSVAWQFVFIYMTMLPAVPRTLQWTASIFFPGLFVVIWATPEHKIIRVSEERKHTWLISPTYSGYLLQYFVWDDRQVREISCYD